MFDSVRNNKKIVQGFLVLITLPFALWGVESYIRNTDAGDDVAVVGGTKISQQELRSALNEQQERLRAQSGGNIDPAMFETPQARRLMLDSLVTRRLLARQAQQSQLAVSDSELARVIAGIPEFQENGQFSKARYEAVISAQGMSKELFEARMRHDLVMRQLVFPIAGAGIPGDISIRRWLAIQLEQREIAEAQLPADAYIAQVKLLADSAQKYYAANHKKFELPEQVRAEFVVLNTDALLAQSAISNDEIKARYDSRIDRYKESETRRASHILISVAKAAPEAEVNTARNKAEEVLAQVKPAPGAFARLAKQYSQDPQSAEKGGDLGWFGRGMMAKAFEDAAFGLQDGQISDIVRSDYGFHIIHVTGVRAERVKSLEDVKAAIADELKHEIGARRYAEAAEAFGNTIYEQADSLAPAAEKWKLAVQQTGWLTKAGKLPSPFDNAKLAGALFSDDAVKNKRNTEAVEVAPGTLVAARVVEHKPAALQDFAAVRASIEKYLIHEEALKLAIKDGEDKLVRLAKGDAVELKWSASRSVSRAAQDMMPGALQAVFKAKTDRLPAYAGIVLPGNSYAIYRINAVKTIAAGKDDTATRELLERYGQAVAEEEMAAWMATLRDRFPVEINKAALEKR